MGFNPRLDETTIFDISKMPIVRDIGKPAVVVNKNTRLSVIEGRAKSELAHERNILKSGKNMKMSRGKSQAFYIEWWDLGDPVTAIAAGTAHTRDIKNLAKLMIGRQKRSIIYIRRESDQKVLWNRRAGSGN